MAGEDKTVYVLDANVFIHGAEHDLSRRFPDAITVPAVTAELESTDAGQRLDVTQVDVYEPSSESVQQVEDVVDELGEALSDADVAVVALALERDAVVVSDDYGVQNVAAALDVDYDGFLQDEIEDTITWIYQCAVCGRSFDADVDRCPDCGGDVERTPAETENG